METHTYTKRRGVFPQSLHPYLKRKQDIKSFGIYSICRVRVWNLPLRIYGAEPTDNDSPLGHPRAIVIDNGYALSR